MLHSTNEVSTTIFFFFATDTNFANKIDFKKLYVTHIIYHEGEKKAQRINSTKNRAISEKESYN